MANFSKKRPAFKPNLDMYKKSGWTKFKEACAFQLSNFKRFMAKVTYRINEKGSQRLTIMIVPHNEKKIVNIQISNYILFFTTVILTVTIFTAVILISENQKTYKNMVRLESLNKDKKIQIDEYKRSIESVNKRFLSFKTDINNIVKTVGNDMSKEKDIFKYKEIPLNDDKTNKNVPMEVTYLEKLELDLEVTKQNIRMLGSYVANQKRLLQEMPSIYPLTTEATITSLYGPRMDPIYHTQHEFHPGIDLCTFPGTPVLATADGKIEVASWNMGYGFMIEIKHKYGISTRYGHLMMFAAGIDVGAEVKQGQTIGYVGSTGKSTGYHLHYEVRIGNDTTDPLPYISMMR